MSFEMLLLIAAGVSAAVYAFVYVDAARSWIRTFTKTVPLLCLALFSYHSGAPIVLTFALALGAVGDAALSRETDEAFLVGLIAFLLAHLGYIALFTPHVSWSFVFDGHLVTLFTVCVLPALGVAVVRSLWHGFGNMRIPATLYAGITTVMAMTGVGAGNALMLASFGAVMFAASDCILAVQKFGPVRWPGMSQFIWWPYVGGQSLILAAFV